MTDEDRARVPGKQMECFKNNFGNENVRSEAADVIISRATFEALRGRK
ncbi:hypothetical protein [Pararobbsia alpina]